MDTQAIQHVITHFSRVQSDKRGILARRRTWFDENGETNVTQTVPYAEFKKLQDQYNGLRGLADQRKTDLDAANARITTLTTEYEGQTSALRTDLDRAVTEANVFKGQHETEKQRADRLAQQDGLVRKILGKKEYAPLTDLFADGLIRVDGMSEEEQVTYLDKLAAKFTTGVQSAAGQLLEGSTPPAPDGTQGLTLTSEQMLDQMMTLDPASKEYQELSAAYVGSLN